MKEICKGKQTLNEGSFFFKVPVKMYFVRLKIIALQKGYNIP